MKSLQLTKILFNFMIPLSMVASLISCENQEVTQNKEIVEVSPDPSCTGLFGMPNEQSGIASDRCSVSCACAQTEMSFQQPNLESFIFSYTHANPIPPPNSDPYQSQDSLGVQTEDVVCVLERNDQLQEYTVQSQVLSEAIPEQITHLGACGACSSLQDLLVYASRTDLTEPVRTCGLQGISQGMEANVDCLRALGFSESCAVIWYYNTLNTRTACLNVCLAQLNKPYLTEAGDLNDCLACDEQESGPVFKYYSGRTRRNSGIASAICRPCASVARLTHDYLFE